MNILPIYMKRNTFEDGFVFSTIRIACLIGWSLFLLSACSGSSSKASGQSTNEEKKSVPCYTAPSVPGLIVDEYDRGIYFISHYWDHFQYEDTTCLQDEELEQVFVDFVVPLTHLEQDMVIQLVTANLSKAKVSKEMFTWFAEMYEKYLYDFGSPVRHEETYALVIACILQMDGVEDIHKIRPKLLLEEIQKNRVGTVATNFSYILENGSKQSMHALASPYTLLFFYDPDCSICKAEKEKMMRSPVFLNLLEQRKIHVLAVSIGAEREQWKAHLKEYPTEWVNGFDANHVITQKELYVIKATPSMYLLDKGKKVLLKDVMSGQVEEWLYEHVTP